MRKNSMPWYNNDSIYLQQAILCSLRNPIHGQKSKLRLKYDSYFEFESFMVLINVMKVAKIRFK